MSKLLCKKILDKVMPSTRVIIARELAKKKIGQAKIAKLLNITQPAVSQYLNDLRGGLVNELESNREMKRYLSKLTEEVLSDKLDLNPKTCSICEKARANGIISKKEIASSICLRQTPKKG
jgi:predicted transcriptional regulator